MDVEKSIIRFHSNLLTFVGKEFTSEFANQLLEIYTCQVKRDFNQRVKITHFIKEISELKEQISQMRYPVIDIKHRYLETVITKANKAKLTVNPCTGRITLKVPETFNDIDRDECEELAEIAITYMNYTPYTYRGTIYKDNVTGERCVRLQTEKAEDNHIVKLEIGD